VKKLQSKVVEKRVRLYEHFQDFDNLRKGVCTIGQVKTVFTILGLDKEVSRDDFKALEDYYSRDDGMFCYGDFCYDIDLAFTQPGLERDPLTQLTMPDASSTLPARRNKQFLDDTQQQKVYDLEERIRAKVKFRRTLLRPAFQDMDRTRRGHVTRSQFGRVMVMLGFELGEDDINDLCGVYCDIGNLREFNYLDFCKSCDPLQDYEQGESNPVAPTDNLPKYFDVFGQVHRLGNTSPGASMPRSPISTAA
jgi:Ca2+-binding EF-hand superfamily protein